MILLRRRDRIAAQQGKTKEQIQADFAALLRLRTTLYLAAPGVLLIVFGLYFAAFRSQQGDSDWWTGLLFIVGGWFLVPLLARNSWRRYRELRRFAEMTPEDFVRTSPRETSDEP